MRVILRKAAGRLFVGETGKWEANKSEAHCFANGVEAIEFARQHGLRGVVIVYEFDGEGFEYKVQDKGDRGAAWRDCGGRPRGNL